MKTHSRCIVAFLGSALMVFTIAACTATTNTPADSIALREAHNKAIVLQYFQEILDGKQYNRMPDVLTYDVVMHRPEGTLTYVDMIQLSFVAALSPHTIATTIHELLASGDYVTARLHHRMTFSTEQAVMQSRLGRFDVRGKTVEWDAMAMFRFRDGKIAEEWVSDDELGKLMQIGTLQLSVQGQE